jgi:hypothetical protein
VTEARVAYVNLWAKVLVFRITRPIPVRRSPVADIMLLLVRQIWGVNALVPTATPCFGRPTASVGRTEGSNQPHTGRLD